MAPTAIKEQQTNGHSHETDAALSSTLAIASVGIATLRMLETLLPAAAEEVESESEALSAHFTTLVGHIQHMPMPPEVARAIEGIIMGMQHQDRNTQVMENVTGILERYRGLLEEVSGDVALLREDRSISGQTMTSALNDILSGIRLSDIRERYLEALRKAHIHSSNEPDHEAGDNANSIEFF